MILTGLRKIYFLLNKLLIVFYKLIAAKI